LVGCFNNPLQLTYSNSALYLSLFWGWGKIGTTKVGVALVKRMMKQPLPF